MELKKKDLLVGFVDPGQAWQPFEGLRSIYGKHFEKIWYAKEEPRRFGSKSGYFHSIITFQDWWAKNFLDEDYDVYIFSSLVRATDLRIGQFENWGKIPIVFWQIASFTLWPGQERWYIEEFGNYLNTDNTIMWSDHQIIRIKEETSKIFLPEIVEQIDSKMRMLPATLDWEHRFQSTETVDLSADVQRLFSEKKVDWLNDFTWNPKIEKISVEQWRQKERPPVLIWNNRMTVAKMPGRLADVLNQLQNQGKDFRLIVTVPSSSLATEFKKVFEEPFEKFRSKISVIALAPSWEMYNMLLNASDYWVGTNPMENWAVSLQDAWVQGAMPVLQDCRYYKDFIVPKGMENHLFEDYSATSAARKIIELDEHREANRKAMTLNKWIITLQKSSDMWLKFFDDLYDDFYKDVKPVRKEDGAIDRIFKMVEKGPISKRNIFKELGWAKPLGWSLYRNKLHKLGVLSRRVEGQGMTYYLPEDTDKIGSEPESAKKLKSRTLF